MKWLCNLASLEPGEQAGFKVQLLLSISGVPNLFTISYHLTPRIFNVYHFFHNNKFDLIVNAYQFFQNN